MIMIEFGDYTEMDVLSGDPPQVQEPVSWQDLSVHLKLSGNAEQDLVLGYAYAARIWCEKYLQRALVEKEITMYYSERATHYALKYPAKMDEGFTVKVDGEVIDDIEESMSFIRTRGQDLVVIPSEMLPAEFTQLTIEYVAEQYAQVDAIKPAIMMLTGRMYDSRASMEIRSPNNVVKNILNYHRIKTI
jgi:hypothetical protein